MPTNFNQFTTGGVPANTEHVVGFNNTSPNGERKWTLQTLSIAVSAIMNAQLQNLVTEQTITLSAPTGTIAYYAAETAPIGWEECDGATITTALGSNYTAIRNFLIAGGYKFGSVGSDPKLPNLKGEFIRSFDTTGLIDNKSVNGAIALNANVITGLDTGEISILAIGDKILTADRPELLGAVITAIGTTSVTIDKTATAADTDLNVIFSRGFGNNQADAFQGHKHDASVISDAQKTTFGSVIGSGSAWTGATAGITVSVLNPTTDGVNGTPRTSSETRPRNIALLACIKL